MLTLLFTSSSENCDIYEEGEDKDKPEDQKLYRVDI